MGIMNQIEGRYIKILSRKSEKDFAITFISVKIIFTFILTFFRNFSYIGVTLDTSLAALCFLLLLIQFRFILFSCSLIEISGYEKTNKNSWEQLWPATVSLFFLCFSWIYILGCISNIASYLEIITHDKKDYIDAFSAITTNILDTDPHIFGVDANGVAFVSIVYLLKFFIIALVIPIIISLSFAAQNSNNRSKDSPPASRPTGP